LVRGILERNVDRRKKSPGPHQVRKVNQAQGREGETSYKPEKGEVSKKGTLCMEGGEGPLEKRASDRDGGGRQKRKRRKRCWKEVGGQA